jgi:DNA-directed RNA polymerase specialized sigma24 family protein
MGGSHAGRGRASLPGLDRSRRYRLAVTFVTSHVVVVEMQSMGQPKPPFTVLAGHTYREPVQVFNRCLMPVYQTSYWWTGNRPDAEDVTTRVFINGFRSLDLPQTVIKVHDELIEATIETIGQHWTERYGVSPQRWSTVRAGEVAAPLRSTLSLRALLDPLPGDLRLVTVLRFLRRRTVDQIAAQLGLSQPAAAILMFRALSRIGTEMGFGASVDDTSQASELAKFVDHLVMRRRPVRFEATPAAFQAMLAATCVHASIAGNDLPRPRFVRSLADGVRWPAV